MKICLVFLLSGFSFGLFAQTQSEITLENVKFKSVDVVLEGTIFKHKRPVAALVLVHGSGKETRMMELAAHLAKNGITVLTYDKRGVGKSGGVYAGPEVGTNNVDSANLRLLALDAGAAVNTLRKHLPSKNMPIGLMGFSQAGWIIPITAANYPNTQFMVLFSCPVVGTLEQLRFQFYTAGDAEFWNTHTEAEAREHIRNGPDRYQFVNTDPREALTKISIPGLWIFGGKDIQIPVHLSIERLNALKAKAKPFDYTVFPEQGHNTALSNSQEPMLKAIQWIETMSIRKKKTL